MVKKVDVFYEGWGERWHLATLADDGRKLLFEYSAEALAQGLELSPRHLKLRAPAYGDFPAYQLGLPGLITDALPDGWGLLLMDRLFRQNGSDPARCSVLDRLSLIGQRTIGALSFQPATGRFRHRTFRCRSGHARTHTYAGRAFACRFPSGWLGRLHDILRAARFLTHDEHAVKKPYQRVVFDVLFNNRDDHPKNFSYRLGQDRRWGLAPAYDLTFCAGTAGYHQMDVCGEALNIRRVHLLRLAVQGGLDQRWAEQVIEQQGDVAQSFAAQASQYAIRDSHSHAARHSRHHRSQCSTAQTNVDRFIKFSRQALSLPSPRKRLILLVDVLNHDELLGSYLLRFEC